MSDNTSVGPAGDTEVSVSFTAEEADWLRHAAELSHLPFDEFVRRAINEQLVRMGVDAVLLRTSDDDA